MNTHHFITCCVYLYISIGSNCLLKITNNSSIRILLSIAAYNDLEFDQIDVKTAFLYGDLSEKILMEQPEGLVEAGSEDMACLLNKSLYRLKLSPRH